MEWFFLLGAIVGIPSILNRFLEFNLQIIGIIFIVLGGMLFIENYYYQKEKSKKFIHELFEDD